MHNSRAFRLSFAYSEEPIQGFISPISESQGKHTQDTGGRLPWPEMRWNRTVVYQRQINC